MQHAWHLKNIYKFVVRLTCGLRIWGDGQAVCYHILSLAHALSQAAVFACDRACIADVLALPVAFGSHVCQAMVVLQDCSSVFGKCGQVTGP